MANERNLSPPRLHRTSFALDGVTQDMLSQLKKLHAAVSTTDYIKGLIALDWLETKKTPLELSRVPAWIVIAYHLNVIDGKVQPRKGK